MIHADGPETVPRSMDQRPPGVLGLLLGNPRICKGVHGPVLHVVLVTNKVTVGSGPVEEQPDPASSRRETSVLDFTVRHPPRYS
jgi:hypothetical protein